MAEVLQHKVVSALPSPLQANSIYYVRVGTGFDVYVTNSSGTIVAYPNNTKAVLTKEWVSSDYTYVTGGTLTIAHTLGTIPRFIEAYAICQTAVYGCAVGEAVVMATISDGDNASFGLGVIARDDELQVRVGISGLKMIRPDNGANQIISPTQWKLRLVAVA